MKRSRAPVEEPERLQKVLSRLGLASRREAEEWIRAGRLMVNGQPAVLGMRVTAADKMHMISMSFIFASLVQSAICMKWDAAGHGVSCGWLDRTCLVIFPLLFALMCGYVVLGAMWMWVAAWMAFANG